MKKNKSKVGQSFLEYSLVIGVVGLVLVAMRPLFTRGIQSMIKTVADQVGDQGNSEQKYEKGTASSSKSMVRGRTSREKQDYLGTTTYSYDDETVSSSESFSNLGFAENN